MREFWLTGTDFEYLDGDLPQGSARRKLINKYHQDSQYTPAWPFVHGYEGVAVEEKWFKFGWGLDPLMIPILKYLNWLEGVETYSSCQGNHKWCPSIHLRATFEGAEKVNKFLRSEKGGFRSYKIFNFIGTLEDENVPSWKIIFYDVLSLMKFNRDGLGVSIEKQLDYPEWPQAAQDFHKLTIEDHRKDMKKFFDRDRPTAKDIEDILNIED